MKGVVTWMRRRCWLLCSLVFVVCLLAGLTVLFGGNSRISHETFAKVEIGMHKTDVENILGTPTSVWPDSVRRWWWHVCRAHDGGNEDIATYAKIGPVDGAPGIRSQMWQSVSARNWLTVTVSFDENDRVAATCLQFVP